jgi:hypothetical protein
MCEEEVALISTFLFSMSLVVGTMGLVFFKTWHKDRKKEGELRTQT